MKIQIVISYVFACNKNKALQLQRVPILSILGYNIGSLAASGSTLLVLRQFCVGKGGKFDHRPERPKVLLYATAAAAAAASYKTRPAKSHASRVRLTHFR